MVSKRFKTFSEEYESMNKRILASYDIRINPDYTELVNAIEDNKVKRLTNII